MNIVLPSDRKSSWLTDFPAGNRNDLSSRSTLISNFGFSSATIRGVGLIDMAFTFAQGAGCRDRSVSGLPGQHLVWARAAPVAPPAAGKIGKTDAGRLWRSSWLAGLDSCSMAGV